MTVPFVDISNAQVAAGAALTTSLMTALRDNLLSTIGRGTGAPKIYGVPYDVQIFSTSGTWTKPSNAESGDIVIVWGVGAGGSGGVDGSSGDRGSGANGGSGWLHRIDDIDDLSSSESVTIGAAPGQNTTGRGSDGGFTQFGTSGNPGFVRFDGGQRGEIGTEFPDEQENIAYSVEDAGNKNLTSMNNEGVTSSVSDGGSHYGGGAGGSGGTRAAPSGVGGHGGLYGGTFNGGDGDFPGGGGGGSRDGNGGAGANGYMIVYCIKEA